MTRWLAALALIVLWLPAGEALAQRFAADAEGFATDYTNMLRATKMPSASDVADQFSSVWPSLTPTQQQYVIDAGRFMGGKRYRVKPFFEDMGRLVVEGQAALSQDPAALDGLLESLSKVATAEPAVNLARFMDQSRAFLANQTLFFSRAYNLRVTGAQGVRFRYEGAPPASAGLPGTESGGGLPGGGFDAAPVMDTPPSKSNDDPFSGWDESPAPADPVNNPVSEGGGGLFSPAFDDHPSPPLVGALIEFDRLDLTMASPFDSVTLAGTKGTYMFATGQFVGEGGRMDWSSVGLEPDVVNVELGTYHFAVRHAHIISQNATLTCPRKLDAPLKGRFEFRSVRTPAGQKKAYPRFISHTTDARHTGLDPDLTLTGGFALAGRRINTSSLDGRPSRLTVRHLGQQVYEATTRRFDLEPGGVISSQQVYSVLPRGSDSLVQAGARLHFESTPIKRIRLYKDRGLYKESPFFDSYHRVEITSDELSYYPDSNRIDFIVSTNRLRKPAVIESMDYFTMDRYKDVGSLYRFHPIGILMRWSSKNGYTDRFSDMELADAYKEKPATIKSAMIGLASQGIITYDPQAGVGVFNPKARHYFLSQTKKKDHDYLSIPSVAPDAFSARIDLDSGYLYIDGVDKFSVNDSLGVTIKPRNRRVKMGKGRDFIFEGEVSAGNFVIHGKEFKFNYDFYQIDLPKIDSIEVMPDAKKKSIKDRAKTASKLFGVNHNEDVMAGSAPNITSAVLFINKPDNKSNREQLAQYPIFDVQSTSYVYFDKETYLNRAYNKRVFFEVPPFRADSISGNHVARISFAGSFHSDDIFPDFEDKLEVREDKTLGFSHKTPEEGYQLYKGPGKFVGTITMDGKGLRGSGEIRYLTTTLKSDNFIFYQDSVVAKGPVVRMDRGMSSDTVGFMDAVADNYELKWLTKADTMYVTNAGKTPWYMYDRQVRMNGTLAITEHGAYGSGLIKASGSRAESPAYTFKQDRLSGRNAFFEVQSANPVKPAFACKNVRFDLFVEEKRAVFQPEEEGFASNEFPYSRYKTSIPVAEWDLEKKLITMTKPEAMDITSSYFYSNLPEQDSLVFFGTAAVYDIQQYQLTITGVPYINVADAMIIPDSGTVRVGQNAEMVPLRNATLIVDTIHRYHRLVNANLTIKSRHVYEGEATYQYVNAVGDTLPIKFDQFAFVTNPKEKVDGVPVRYTKSGGEIDEEAPLRIASGVLYKGSVTMIANRPALEFDGYVKLDLRKTDTEWLRYRTTGESREFVLDLKNANDAEGNPLTTGLFIEDGSTELYGIFVNSKRTTRDAPVFAATGVMNYNSDNAEFKVGQTSKMEEKTLEGQVFNYSDSTGRASFEGRMSFLSKAPREVSLEVSGTGSGSLDSSRYDFNTFMLLQMALPPKAWAAMTKTIQTRVKDVGLEEAVEDRTALGVRIAEIAGEKVGREYLKLSSAKAVPLQQVWSRFGKGVVMTPVPMRWNKKESAFHSRGEQLGVYMILGQMVNAQMRGYFEVKKSEESDLVSLYIEASPDAWFFFGLDDQRRLGAVSSVQAFNDAINEKSRPRPGSYYIELAEESEKNNFLKHFLGSYQGMDYKAPVRERDPDVDDPRPTAAPGNDESDEEAPAKPVAKKKKKKKTKPATDPADEDGGDPADATAATDDDGFGGPARRDPDTDDTPPPPPKKKKKPVVVVNEEPESVTSTEPEPAAQDEEAPAPKPKRKKPKRSEADDTEAGDAGDKPAAPADGGNDEEAETAPKPKPKKPAKPKKSADEEPADTPPPAAPAEEEKDGF